MLESQTSLSRTYTKYKVHTVIPSVYCTAGKTEQTVDFALPINAWMNETNQWCGKVNTLNGRGNYMMMIWEYSHATVNRRRVRLLTQKHTWNINIVLINWCYLEFSINQ